MPTDAALTIEHPWDALLEPSLPRPPHGWATGDVRVMHCQAADAAAPTPWLVNVGALPASDPGWHVAGAAEFVAAATAHLKEASPRRGRARLLLGLPVVGTGHGGVADVKGTVTRLLVDGLARAAADHGVDVALVTSSDHAFAAAQDARRRLIPTDGLPDPWAELTPESIDLARQLGAHARDGHLVLFLGAGIGQSAGLPLWRDLILMLADVIGIPDPSILDRLSDPLDQARLLQARFADAGKPLGDAIVELLEPFTRVSLAHTLLAALPVTEAATTNYDTLFEKARLGAGRPLAALPYEPAGSDGWILKLHGSLDHRDDIVLTRDDYLGYAARRAALMGIVQALLITRKMLFLGFSLTDPNFHRVVHDVRSAVAPDGVPSEPFGTAVMLSDDPVRSELWKGSLRIHGLGGDPPAQGARRLDMFLDLLLSEASPTSAHLLNLAYDGLLTDAERKLRDALTALEAAGKTNAGSAPAWAQVDELMRRLGRN